MIQILTNYREAWLHGLGVTLAMATIIWSTGILLGVPFALISLKLRRFGSIALAVTEFTVGTLPILVILMWLHFPLQSAFNLVLPPFWTCTLALSVVNIFLVAGITKSAISSVPSVYVEAAKLCGLNPKQRALHIQVPLVIQRMSVPLMTSQVTMLHATLFGSLISVEELFRVAQQINSQEYHPIEVYSILAIIFLVLSAPIVLLVKAMSRRFEVEFVGG